MRLIGRAVGGLLALMVALAAGGLLLPSDVRVARSVVIAAAPETVFARMADLRQVALWSPWRGRDPAMTQRFSGSATGVGARLDWQSARADIGPGAQEITALTPDARVATALRIGPLGVAEAEWLLQPLAGGTLVTWTYRIALGPNPVARYTGAMLDRWVGADLELGLDRLKALVEDG